MPRRAKIAETGRATLRVAPEVGHLIADLMELEDKTLGQLVTEWARQAYRDKILELGGEPGDTFLILTETSNDATD